MKRKLIDNRTNDISLNVEEAQEAQSALFKKIDNLNTKIDNLEQQINSNSNNN